MDLGTLARIVVTRLKDDSDNEPESQAQQESGDAVLSYRCFIHETPFRRDKRKPASGQPSHLGGPEDGADAGVRLLLADNSNVCDFRGSDRNMVIQTFEHQAHLASDIAVCEPIRATS